MHYLYKIVNNLNGKIYIGQSNNPKRRWGTHKTLSKNGNPIQYINRAMIKYGIDNFTFEIIATCKTKEDADATESLLIQQYNSRDKNFGYNIAPGGSAGWNKGLPKELQPGYRRVVSTQTRKKISESNKGRVVVITDEQKIKMSESRRGKHPSNETIFKISESNKGLKRSEETRNKISLAMTGKKYRLGKSHNEESKQKMSKSKLKFSWDTQLEIIGLHASGATQVELAKRYECNRATIANIIKRNKS